MSVHYKEAVKTGKVPEDIITRKAKILTLVDSAVSDPDKIDNNEILSSEINIENVQETFEQLNNTESIIIDSNNTVIPISITDNIINLTPNVLTDENGQQKITIIDGKSKQQIEQILGKNIIDIEAIKPIQKEKFACCVCSKEFSSKYFLDRHTVIHTGEKNYSCDICTKKFNQKSSLESHKRTHNGNRPYNCPYCSNTFSQRGNLKTHMKR